MWKSEFKMNYTRDRQRGDDAKTQKHYQYTLNDVSRRLVSDVRHAMLSK